MSDAARKTFELLNGVRSLDPQDEILLHDAAEQKRINADAPWKRECVAVSSLRLGALAGRR
jgi:hypothetical protein